MSKKKKNRFANVIIIFVLLVTTAITAWVMWEYHRLSVTVTSDVLKIFFAFYGGELLIVALRQVFGSDIVRKDKKEGNDYE